MYCVFLGTSCNVSTIHIRSIKKLDLSRERIFHFQVKMEIEHCMPCPPEIDAKAALSKSYLTRNLEFANRRAKRNFNLVDVFDKDMDTLDEITRAFRQIVRENRKLQDEVVELKKQVKPKKKSPLRFAALLSLRRGPSVASSVWMEWKRVRSILSPRKLSSLLKRPVRRSNAAQVSIFEVIPVGTGA